MLALLSNSPMRVYDLFIKINFNGLSLFDIESPKNGYILKKMPELCNILLLLGERTE